MRPCLDCGRPSAGTRCRQDQAAQDRARRRRRPVSWAERQRRARVVASFVELHGYVCPGCPLSDGQPHPADPDGNPLTADHLVPVGAGGPEDGPLRVLCRAGNAARGASNK